MPTFGSWITTTAPEYAPTLYTYTPVLRATGTSDPTLGTGGVAFGEFLVTPLVGGLFDVRIDFAFLLGTTPGLGDGVWFVEGPAGLTPRIPMQTAGMSSENVGTAVAVNASGSAGNDHATFVVALSDLYTELARVTSGCEICMVPVGGLNTGNGISTYIASGITTWNTTLASYHSASTGAEAFAEDDQLRGTVSFTVAAGADFSGFTLAT